MKILKTCVDLLSTINATILRYTRSVAWVLIALMVAVILLQVFFRYVLNNALPWTEEAARSMMIWMMAAIAPTAYRWGGFVSIDMLRDALPKRARGILTIILLLIATAVLGFLIVRAIDHFNSGFLFTASGLKIKLAWIYLAMTVCFGLMLSVNIEILLREFGRTFGNENDFPLPETPHFMMPAE